MDRRRAGLNSFAGRTVPTTVLDGRDAALIWALHGYFVPTNKIIRIDPKTNKKVTTKFTIKDSQESVIFVGETQQAIEDHIEHIKKQKLPFSLPFSV